MLSIKKNFAYNLVGSILPLFFALVTIPRILTIYGTEKFGILLIGWSLVGYFSLFDMGLSQAINHRVSSLLQTKRSYRCITSFSSGLLLMIVTGCIGSLLLYLTTPTLVTQVFKVNNSLVSESILCFKILAATIPIVIISSGFRAALSAYQRFDLINIVRIPLGSMTYIGPWLATYISSDLSIAIWLILIVRISGLVAYIACIYKVNPGLIDFRVAKKDVSELIKYGGWITVTHTVKPVIAYMDRFLIATLISMIAVTYFTTPSEIVSRLLIIPGALVGVLFPALTASYKTNLERSVRLYNKTDRYVMLAIFPIVFILYQYAAPLLTAWVGNEFSSQSNVVTKILLLGLLVNSTGAVATAVIQSSGRPDLPAKIYLCEAPVYFVMLYLLILQWGILGAAIGYLIRILLNVSILKFLANKLITNDPRPALKNWWSVLTLSILFLLLGDLFSNIYFKHIYVAIILFLYIGITWKYLIFKEEKNLALKFINVKT